MQERTEEGTSKMLFLCKTPLRHGLDRVAQTKLSTLKADPREQVGKGEGEMRVCSKPTATNEKHGSKRRSTTL